MATDDFAERLEDELASPCPCGSGLSSLLCKEHGPMAKQPTPLKGLDLIPITSEVQQQKRAHRLLGDIYGQADREQLPQIRWCIGTTGTLIGEVDVIEPEAAPIVFDAWAKALQLDIAEKRRVCEKELRATGKRDGVHIILKAEEA